MRAERAAGVPQARVPMHETVGVGHQAARERWVLAARDAPRLAAKTAARRQTTWQSRRLVEVGY